MKIATASVDNGKHLRTPCLKNVGYPAMELKSSNLQTSTLAGLRKIVHIKVPNYPSTIQKPFKHLLGPFCDMMNNYTNLHHLTQNESFTSMISYQSVKDSNEIHTSMVILDAFN